MHCGVVVNFESVDEILNPKVWPFKWKLVSSTFLWSVYYAVQNSSNVWVCGRNTKVWPFTCKPIEQHFLVVLFIMLYKVVLTSDSVDEILKCDHSSESYWAVLSSDVVYYAVQGSSNFWVCGWNPKVWPFKWKLLSSTLQWWCLLCCTSWF